MNGYEPLWMEQRHVPAGAVAVPVGDQFALVDYADAQLVERFRWCKLSSHGSTYARRNILRNGRLITQLMHTLITGWPQVDHRNGDGLDNRRSNLRPATTQQNNCNQISRAGTSPYKGVSWHSRDSRWHAQIQVNRRKIHLGAFLDQEAAAAAYDDAAREHFGEFAALNFPMPGEQCALQPGGLR